MIGSINFNSESLYDVPLKPETGNPCGIPPSKDYHHDGILFIEST